jgi:hypothetical protein
VMICHVVVQLDVSGWGEDRRTNTMIAHAGIEELYNRFLVESSRRDFLGASHRTQDTNPQTPISSTYTCKTVYYWE